MNIKITTENFPAIESALKAVNGKATAHTFTTHTYLVSWDRKTVVNELDDGAEDLVTLGYRVVATTKSDARNIVTAYRDGLAWANEYALRGRIETIAKKIAAI